MRGIRRPILAAAIAGVVLVVALLCWYFLTQQGGPARSSIPYDESNVLLAGVDDTRDGPRARELVVMAKTDVGSVVCLIVPDELVIKLPDGESTEIGAAYEALGEADLRTVIGSLLGIELSGTIALSSTGIAGLVDELGGVSLSVEMPVVDRRMTEDGEVVVEVGTGEQALGGREALAYVRGSSEIPRVVRQQTLLQAFLSEMLFAADGSRSARDAARLAEAFVETALSSSVLVGFATAIAGSGIEGIQAPILPTEVASVDGDEALYLRVVEAERIVARSIRGVEFLTPSDVDIAVFNGNGVRLMASRTADYLRDRGFEVTRIANAESFDYPASYIVVLTDEAKAWVLRDALPAPVNIVFPEAFEEHVEALSDLVPFGTDLMLIAGAGMEIE